MVELASMLAGEAFSDRPRCVDPVLAAFLRAFNDRLGHVSRQRLKPYAALAVGTSGDRAVTRARRERCLAFAAGSRRAGARPRRIRLRVLLAAGPRAALRLDPGAALWAARALDARGVEPHGFALLDALLADGGLRPPGSAPSPAPTRGRPPRDLALAA